MGLEIINKIKKDRGLTSKQLAEKSQVPVGTLNKILNGQTKNPAYETIFAIANALDCSVDIFCNDIKQTNTSSELSNEEIILLEHYNRLNDLGKKKVVDYTKDLTETPRYTSVEKNEEYNLAAHDDGLDEETAKKTLEKAKAIFKQMDEE